MLFWVGVDLGLLNTVAAFAATVGRILSFAAILHSSKLI